MAAGGMFASQTRPAIAPARYTVTHYTCAETLRRRGHNIDPAWRFPDPVGAVVRISIPDIQNAVAERFGIDPREMTSARRGAAIARPRQVAMFLARELTPRSMPEIGRRFGNRDHATVMHAIRQVEKRRAADAELRETIQELSTRLSIAASSQAHRFAGHGEAKEALPVSASWCAQCERRAYPSEVSKCGSRWCPLKAGEAVA